MSRRGVFFDLVAAQSPSYRGRGIARYSTEFVRAMVRGHPELVSGIVVHPELPKPADLDGLDEWVTTDPDWADGSVVHLSSVFEPEVPVRTFWPRSAATHRLLTVVTLYDLIPDIFPGWYLEDPGLRRRWRCCREVVRAADAVLTPSESTKRDTVELLGLPEHRVTVIGSGTSPSFHPPKSQQTAFRTARKGVRGLKEGFIIYNGAFAPAKNVDRLLEAYGRMPPELIALHQLVIACEAPPLTRNHYLVMAKEMGLEGRVLIPGFVPEDVLVGLHQSAALGVFPSLYEGYGLPVIESMACGAPNIVADNSSLREILPRQARFQGEDPAAIADAMTRALTDATFRRFLIDLARREPPSWASVADRAAAVFDELVDRPRALRPGWRHKPCVALVGAPAELATAVGRLAFCDRFDLPPAATPTAGAGGGGPARPGSGRPPRAVDEDPEPVPAYEALAKLDLWRNGYDAVIGWFPHRAKHDARAMEVLARDWRGRTVLLVGDAPAAGAAARVKKAGGRVLALSPGAGWESTARLVITAARGTPG